MKMRRWLVLVVLGILLTACGSLPGDLEKQAKAIPKNLDSLEKTLSSREADFRKFTQDDDAWTFYKPYAEREKWEEVFGKTRDEIGRLRKLHKDEVKPLLKADREEDAEALKTQIARMNSAYDGVNRNMRFVSDRMVILREGKENAKPWLGTVGKQIDEINASVIQADDARKKARQEFVSKAADIDVRFAPIMKLQEDANAVHGVVQEQYTLHENSSADVDYAAFADGVKKVDGIHGEIQSLTQQYGSDVQSLYSDYTLILADQKVEYAVQLGRSTWDNGSDWDTTKNATFEPIRVSEEDFVYLQNLPQGEGKKSQGNLARLYRGGKKIDIYIDNNVWNRFGINAAAQWVSRHDEGNVWIEDLTPLYFHKYTEVKGQDRTDLDWTEVDEEDYFDTQDALGMAIESKPLGMFSDEAIEEPTPPGMANVGNEKYGEWRSDGSGNSFWHYYGIYSFWGNMLGGNNTTMYSRNDYDSWRSHRSQDPEKRGYGYYGGTATNPKYGSAGSATAQSSKYANSSYAKSGGFKRSQASVRGGGASSRNRGPGGRGK